MGCSLTMCGSIAVGSSMAAGGSMAAAIALAACGAPAPRTPSELDVQVFTQASLACVADAGSRDESEACRRAARKDYCQRFPTLAICHPDE